MNVPPDGCTTCACWVQRPDSIYGECRRHAPAVPTDKNNPTRQFPVTSCDDWCFDWKEKTHEPTG